MFATRLTEVVQIGVYLKDSSTALFQDFNPGGNEDKENIGPGLRNFCTRRMVTTAHGGECLRIGC
jgi:hypothetical protein